MLHSYDYKSLNSAGLPEAFPPAPQPGPHGLNRAFRALQNVQISFYLHTVLCELDTISTTYVQIMQKSDVKQYCTCIVRPSIHLFPGIQQ